jgi:hypothetical protein
MLAHCRAAGRAGFVLDVAWIKTHSKHYIPAFHLQVVPIAIVARHCLVAAPFPGLQTGCLGTS